MDDQTSTELENLERVFNDTGAQPINISYTAIKYITKNFAQEIGAGGFGKVYLGGLRNGMVAVKKISNPKDISNKQFRDEVACLTKATHRNIARFLGYCADTQGRFMKIEGKLEMAEDPRMLLCFEYVPNGNLHHYLKEKTHGYEWNVRYLIIKGICQGLHYIHQEYIIHLDLKPANVLLGANMEPKITDFGVSRSIDKGQHTIETKNFFGTQGYIAPEFIDDNKYSFKSDIYSLGVIMVNLLTGRTGGITSKWHETIDAACPQMKMCIEIAQKCVDTDPRNRPTTGEIIRYLNEREIMIEEDPPIIIEPRDDPKSSLHQVVQRFRGLPETLREDSREGTPYMKLDFLDCVLEGSKSPGRVPFHLLQFITDDFSDKRKIDETGFAWLFKGILRQQSVTVKRLSMSIHFDEQMFRNEVQAMLLAQHKNIVQFLGYCSHIEEEAIEYQGKFIMAEIRERLLCFEYLSNGSLSDYISDASCGLEWGERYQIIKGICEGLRYLHGKNIVHMDIKTRNILLDDNMVPKIADFCLSRCFHEYETRVLTMRIFGTMGYMAPESMKGGVFSSKSDIYSLGVTIKEILSGDTGNREIENVLESWKMRLEEASSDTRLLEQVRVCAEISIACTEFDPEKRPDIQRIIEMLVGTETEGAVAVKDMQD